MAADNFAVILTRTASTTLPIGTINADGSSPEQVEVYYLSVSSLATPTTARYQLLVQRCTSTGTGVPVTPTYLGVTGSPPTASTDAAQEHTVAPTYTAGAYLLSEGFHQGSSFKFWAASGRGLSLPATASAGMAFLTPIGPAASIVLTAHIAEGT